VALIVTNLEVIFYIFLVPYNAVILAILCLIYKIFQELTLLLFFGLFIIIILAHFLLFYLQC